jgi:excisionase family DNA binding protein
MKDKGSNDLPLLLTVAEVAKCCSVSVKQVRRWIKERGLRIYRPGRGRLIRIAKSDLAEFLSDGREA